MNLKNELDDALTASYRMYVYYMYGMKYEAPELAKKQFEIMETLLKTGAKLNPEDFPKIEREVWELLYKYGKAEGILINKYYDK
jgi:hypothetical protein